MEKQLRQSNIEVLRILAMFMILLGHAWYHYEQDVGDYAGKLFAMHFINPLLYMHVDIFVLISGYFGLSLKLPKIVSLYTTCLFYTLLAVTFVIAFPKFGPFHWKALVFPITQGDWWFIRIYLSLLLVSPMLNLVIDYCHVNHRWRELIAVAFVFNFYLSWFHRVDGIYSMGFDLCNFSCLYILGRYVLLKGFSWSVKYTAMALIVLLFIKLCLSELGFFYPVVEKFVRVKTYCNPLNVFSALLILVLFLHWKRGWSNRYVNYISASTLAVYLTTDNQYVRGGMKYFTSKMYNVISDNYLYPFIFLVFLIFIFLLCILLDKFRVKVTNPLDCLVYRLWKLM